MNYSANFSHQKIQLFSYQLTDGSDRRMVPYLTCTVLINRKKKDLVQYIFKNRAQKANSANENEIGETSNAQSRFQFRFLLFFITFHSAF